MYYYQEHIHGFLENYLKKEHLEIQNYIQLSSKFNDRFYLEIQRHGDQNEIAFEKFNLNKSSEVKIPIIATNEVYYLNQDMHEAHDALTCIGTKTMLMKKIELNIAINITLNQ